MHEARVELSLSICLCSRFAHPFYLLLSTRHALLLDSAFFFSIPNVSFYFKCYANSQASASATARATAMATATATAQNRSLLSTDFVLYSFVDPLLAEAKAKAIPIHSDYSQSKSVSVPMCVCVSVSVFNLRPACGVVGNCLCFACRFVWV